MFTRLRRARADLATMHALFPAAERIANEDGIERPGAEHLLVASLDLDEIASMVLHSFDVDRAALRAAIVAQHDEALRAIGVIADDNAIAAALPPTGRPGGPYRSQGSLQTAFRRAVDLAKADGTALNSGHLLLAVTDAEHGTVGRVLDHLAIDPMLLRDRTSQLLGESSAGPR